MLGALFALIGGFLKKLFGLGGDEGRSEGNTTINIFTSPDKSPDEGLLNALTQDRGTPDIEPKNLTQALAHARGAGIGPSPQVSAASGPQLHATVTPLAKGARPSGPALN